jgi:hypothetical protein
MLGACRVLVMAAAIADGVSIPNLPHPIPTLAPQGLQLLVLEPLCWCLLLLAEEQHVLLVPQLVLVPVPQQLRSHGRVLLAQQRALRLRHAQLSLSLRYLAGADEVG